MEHEQYVTTLRETLVALATHLDRISAGSEPRTEVEFAVIGATAWVGDLRIDGYLGTNTTWSFIVNSNGQVGYIRMTREGDIILGQKVDEVIGNYHELGAHRLAEMVCELILGTPYIPPVSRAELRIVEQTATDNATEVFVKGMQGILTGAYGGNGWTESDNSERWSYIESVGYEFIRHSTTHLTRTGVPFYNIDVYQDAYVQRAYELVTTIYPEKN